MLQGVGIGVRVELPWQGYASNSMVSFDSINDNGGGSGRIQYRMMRLGAQP